MKYGYEWKRLWNKIWTSQATPCSLYFGKKRVSMWLIEIIVSFAWKVPGWLPDFLSVLVFFAKSVSKALLTVVGRVVHTHMSFFIPQVKNTAMLCGWPIPVSCGQWPYSWQMGLYVWCALHGGWWVTKTSKSHRSPREVGCNWATPMQAASRVTLIKDIVLDDSLNVHCCLHYFPPHESFFCYGYLSVTIVSTANVIPTSTMSGL